ncbi:MAG TPA: methyltransferase domain-containing protein [Flavobacteriales bacterium]
MDWFGTRYYALLYGHRDQLDARAWVDMIIHAMGLVPGQRLLDMACGRGRHAECFAKAGLRVTGVDLSVASIQEATARVPEAVFKVHDFRTPVSIGDFDAVVCLFTSLGYSKDRDDDRRALRSVHTCLKPGGRLVLDLMNGNVVRRSLVAEERCRVQGVDFSVRRRLHGDGIVKTIAVQDNDRQLLFEEYVHLWEVDEVQALVEAAGLMVDRITDGPAPVTFRPAESQRIVVHAHRP